MDNPLLQLLHSRTIPIKVGVFGAGRFSSGLFGQINTIKGMEIAVVADVEPRYAVDAFRRAGYAPDDIVSTDSPAKVKQAMEQGKRVVCEHPLAMLETDIEVAVDASGLPVEGGEFCFRAIRAGKHVVNANVEADSAIGPALRQHADAHGVIYTLADGDQPSLAKGLYDWAHTLGLTVSLIGKWTGSAASAAAAAEHADDGLVVRVSDVAYHDGSKNQMEMACIANMTGYTVDKPGMHMPEVDFEDIANRFRLHRDGGILQREGVVDVVQCKREDRGFARHLRGGVFLLVTSPDPLVLRQLNTKGITMSRDGKCGIIYRQHHLVGVETPMTIMKACLEGVGTGVPRKRLSVDVVAVAKTDLRAGQRLDGQGGKTVYGIAVPASESMTSRCLPLALAQRVKVNQDVAKGTAITFDMLEEKENSVLWQLREEVVY